MVFFSIIMRNCIPKSLHSIITPVKIVAIYPQRYAHSSSNVILNESSPVPVFRLVQHWPLRIAITDQYGNYSYQSLFLGSRKLATDMNKLLDGRTQERVAFLCPNNASYVLTQWACWMSGQIAVPLSSSHPVEMLEYFVRDSDCSLLATTKEYEQKIKTVSQNTGVPLMLVNDDCRNEAVVAEGVKIQRKTVKGGLNPNLYSKHIALILYTSGTTSSPKGVVLSYGNVLAQVNAMLSAWGWKSEDSILHCLPLHHIHGIMNALLTPLYCGARCVMLPKFNPNEVWNQLLNVCTSGITVFSGVPTMYVKLIEEYDKSWSNNHKMINYIKATCSQKIRLMMCGSAPLPDTVFDKWEDMTGHRLLERYGMTETGMTITNPLNGLRKPGFVGNPLPGVSIRIVDNKEIIVQGDSHSTKITVDTGKKDEHVGELQVKGENVFKQYWRKPEMTEKEFTNDGWFRTGDTAQYKDNSYKILGRLSVDIIKSGGYKISAVFMEGMLLQHPNISDVAVFGIPDSTWGQKVIAVISVMKEDKHTIITIKKWASNKIPLYMMPAVWRIIPEIPRNTMGKIDKKDLIKKMKIELQVD